jgi:hypothetical protein
MNKEFIPYEQALELKELGFNEQCLKRYWFIEALEEKESIKLLQDLDCELKDKYFVKAPLYQQAFRWFREMIITHISDETSYLEGRFTLLPLIYLNGYEIHVTPESTSFTSNMNYNFIPMYEFPSKRKVYKESTDTYDNAQLACLKKLIEIVKNK